MSKWSSRTSDQFIWLVSEKQKNKNTEAVNAYFIKNSKEEGERGMGGWGGGGALSQAVGREGGKERDRQTETQTDTERNLDSLPF